MTPFVASVSRAKIALLLAVAVAMIAVSGFVAQTTASPDDATTVRIIGGIGVLFFGACAIVIARQFFHSGPVMEIGPHGIVWRRWSDQTIPWAAIERAERTSIQRQRFLSLWLSDPGAYRSSKMLGKLGSASTAMGFGDISLSAQGLDRSFEEMVAAVAAFAPGLIRH